MEQPEELKPNLAAAIVAVMKACAGGVDKNSTVGSGTNAYKAVSDIDVKKLVGQAMIANGLCILPIGVVEDTNVEIYSEADQWSKPEPWLPKRKVSVFTKVVTHYKLLHTSGEFEILCGFGHGADSQDKSAGKATTYALKNLLLYTFMIPSALIDDTDKTHSDELTGSSSNNAEKGKKTAERKPVPITEDDLKKALSATVADLEKTIKVVKAGKVRTATPEQIEVLDKKLAELKAAKNPESKPEVWITADQLKIALESDAAGITSTLNAIKKKHLYAKDEEIKKLEEKLVDLNSSAKK